MARQTGALGRGPALVYALTGLLLATQPLFGVLHVEASAVVAAVGFVTAGWSYLGRRPALGAHLRAHALGLAIPWAVLTATLLIRPNCDYAAGLGFYVLFAGPSVVLGTALAYALAPTRFPRLAFAGLSLAVATLPVLYDLGLHPQLYTYNHVWGGVLGPIYDEELAVRPGLFAFRSMSLCWAVALVAFGRWRRQRAATPAWVRVAGGGAAAVLVLGYTFAVPLGVNTSYARLDQVLGSRIGLPHGVLHYEAGSLSPEEVARLRDAFGYRYASLREQLGVAPDDPVHLYVYPDPETRGALIGSRQTSVTPVWLARPQLHMLQSALTADALGHELVHVFSREFGLSVLRASLAVGLVEGLAVALEPPDGLPSPAAQVAATLRIQTDSLGALDAGPADALAGAMDPIGFWTGRGAVSYLTSGAFTGWLLGRNGAEPVRRVYASGDFEAVYGEGIEALARAWEADLTQQPVSPEAVALARWRFAQPSLFERRCPHHVPPAVRWTRRADEAESQGRADEAFSAYVRALDADSTYLLALLGWASHVAVEHGDPAAARDRLAAQVRTDVYPSPGLLVGLADLHALAGDSAGAARVYARAADALPPWADASRAFLGYRAALGRDALRALLRSGRPEEQVRALTELLTTDRTLRPFLAWRLREAGRLAEASAVLDAWPSAESSTPLRVREDLAMKAAFALEARRYDAVLRWAGAARPRFVEAGLDGRVRQLDDWIAEARWQRAADRHRGG